MATLVRYIDEQVGKKTVTTKEYPASIEDLQEGDCIFLTESEDTDINANQYVNSILAQKGLAIANYRKEIVSEETGEISIYRFVGKPLSSVVWGKGE